MVSSFAIVYLCFLSLRAVLGGRGSKSRSLVSDPGAPNRHASDRFLPGPPPAGLPAPLRATASLRPTSSVRSLNQTARVPTSSLNFYRCCFVALLFFVHPTSRGGTLGGCRERREFDPLWGLEKNIRRAGNAETGNEAARTLFRTCCKNGPWRKMSRGIQKG